jgi:hypothetical protein
MWVSYHKDKTNNILGEEIYYFFRYAFALGDARKSGSKTRLCRFVQIVLSTLGARCRIQPQGSMAQALSKTNKCKPGCYAK